MLVLSRKPGESIVIGDEIVLTVVEVRGDQVRIGIDAPRAIAVHRKVVHDELVAANRVAAGSGTVDVSKLPRPAPRQS